MRIFIFILPVILILILIYLIDYLVVIDQLKKEGTEGIVIRNNTIDFYSLTLRQKLAQMIVVRGKEKNIAMTRMNIGGIFLDKLKTKEDYKRQINNFQNKSKIKLLVSADMEGRWNPFFKFIEFPAFSEIKNKEEAYNSGLGQGKLMKELGFNLNFAPVAEFKDESYGGRVFSGSEEEIKGKLAGYIKGLQENVNGTCKHYPGKGLIKNLHRGRDYQSINKEDLELFQLCFDENISAVMVGHQIVNGEIDSKGKQASVSKEIIGSLKEQFEGLIISDEINMFGLKFSYLFNKIRLYKDLINSGENLILDFSLNSVRAHKLILKLEKAVERGEIDEEKINESARKILKFKGYKVG